MRDNREIIIESITGYTRQDFEPIFEEIIMPVYLFQCQQTKALPPKYRIINRETGEEMSTEEAMEITYKLRYSVTEEEDKI